MSENDVQDEPTGGAAAGTAVKALAAAAATGAAAYAVQKALSSRNGHDSADADGPEGEDDAPQSEAEPQTDDEEAAEDDSPQSQEQPEADDEEGDEEEAGAEPRAEGDDDVDDDGEYEEPDGDEGGAEDQPGSAIDRRSSGRSTKLRLVGSSALVPLAGQAANAAGRYLAEHAPDVVKETIVPGFIEGFEKAS